MRSLTKLSAGLKVIAMGVISLAISRCAPAPVTPPQPSATNAAKTSSQEAGQAPQVQATAVPNVNAQNLLGARVGPEDLRRAVHECNVTGAFYNRTQRACDRAVKLTTFPCREAEIMQSGVIRSNELAQFTAILQVDIHPADAAAAYQFDQCVVPTTPDADTGKIYRMKIFLAREQNEGGTVKVVTKVLRFEQ